MAERREERDLSGAGGLPNNPLLDDLLLSAAAAAASGSSQPGVGSNPLQQQQQQQQYQSWASSFDHLNLPSAYSGWYGQPSGMGFGPGPDLLSGAFPNYDDLLQATVNQGATPAATGAAPAPPPGDDPLLSKPPFVYGSGSQTPPASVPSSGGLTSGAFHATQQGMVFPSPPPPTGGVTSTGSGLGGAGNSFQIGDRTTTSDMQQQRSSYPGNAPDLMFPKAAADGRSMYADAMNRWDMYQGSIYSAFQEPKPIDPSPWGENQKQYHHHQQQQHHSASAAAVTRPVPSEFIHSPPHPYPHPLDGIHPLPYPHPQGGRCHRCPVNPCKTTWLPSPTSQ